MRSNARGVLLTCCLLTWAPVVRADVKLPAIFGDHMVLQRDQPVPVWGWAEPGEEVTVSIAGQTLKTVANKEREWSVRLDKLGGAAGTALTIRGKNTIVLQDVLVGEVWLASGQSNMAMAVQRCGDFEREKAHANYPQVRMFTVTSGAAKTPQRDCRGKWVVCTPETVGSFAGTAYFFGRELHQQLGVPVGLVNSSVGGTAIEAWTSKEAVDNKKELVPAILGPWKRAAAAYDPAQSQTRYENQLELWKGTAAKAKAEEKPVPRRPTKPVPPTEDRNYPGNLFNGKIAPLVPFAVRGAIWYQGEQNARADVAKFYGVQLTMLIQDWRARWNQEEFPFAWVQLPNFNTPGSNWPVIREGMLQGLELTNTGMAVTIDIGDPMHIHPANKQDVGKRLALWALASVYGKDLSFSGPLLERFTIRGGKITLYFDHADDGLKARGGALQGFSIAGADRQWRPALATISGRGKVVVSNPDVTSPVAVRYAWENNPIASLYNGAGLPASPFRTDGWD